MNNTIRNAILHSVIEKRAASNGKEYAMRLAQLVKEKGSLEAGIKAYNAERTKKLTEVKKHTEKTASALEKQAARSSAIKAILRSLSSGSYRQAAGLQKEAAPRGAIKMMKHVFRNLRRAGKIPTAPRPPVTTGGPLALPNNMGGALVPSRAGVPAVASRGGSVVPAVASRGGSVVPAASDIIDVTGSSAPYSKVRELLKRLGIGGAVAAGGFGAGRLTSGAGATPPRADPDFLSKYGPYLLAGLGGLAAGGALGYGLGGGRGGKCPTCHR